jgi:hypothetical protein
MHTLSTRIIKELGEALKMFGSYTFDDKGPQEVMGINELCEELRKLPAKEACDILVEVATCKKHKGRGLSVAMSIACDLQDWDELYANEVMGEILNGEPIGEPKVEVTPVPIKVMSMADVMEQFTKKLTNP